MTWATGKIAPRRVVCAALRLGEQIICGARHYDSLMIQQIQARKEDWRTAEQGFVDQRGEWLTREEAWIVADGEQQIIRDPDWMAGHLHSEHLY
jgi:hypothetical protein